MLNFNHNHKHSVALFWDLENFLSFQPVARRGFPYRTLRQLCENTIASLYQQRMVLSAEFATAYAERREYLGDMTRLRIARILEQHGIAMHWTHNIAEKELISDVKWFLANQAAFCFPKEVVIMSGDSHLIPLVESLQAKNHSVTLIARQERLSRSLSNKVESYILFPPRNSVHTPTFI